MSSHPLLSELLEGFYRNLVPSVGGDQR